MSRYTKTQITQLSANEQAAINAINKNLSDIQTAIEDTVSRSGNTPTHMTNSFDMNGKRIINVPEPVYDTDVVRKKDVSGAVEEIRTIAQQAVIASNSALESAQESTEASVSAADSAIDSNNYSLESKKWAIGEPSEPEGHSSKWWAEHSGLPSQTGQSGKYLTTDGSGASWKEALNYNNISNCITEIQQDIKLEINDSGSLILKSGSKVYIPDGAGVFTPVTFNSDKELMVVGSDGATKMLVVDSSGYYGWRHNPSECFSGTTAPTGSTNMLWYDITNNVIKRTEDGGSTWLSTKYSLPVCIATRNETTCSIDQIFNGFGYIGNKVFILPGVKCLIPNGRNADGSLKNTEYNNTSVRLTSTDYWYGDKKLYISNIAFYISESVVYDEKQNLCIDTNGTNSNVCIIGDINLDSSFRVQTLKPKITFHALDYNDFSELKNDYRELKTVVDNDVAKLSGNQTFSGTNTFSQTIEGNISGSSASCTGNSATATKATQDGNGNNIVNTYADKSASNFNETGKLTITGWGAPDFSTGVSITASKLISGYSVPYQGFIKGMIKKANEGNVAKYININAVGVIGLPYEYSGADTSFFIPVSKNDYVQASTNENNLTGITIFKAKGV